MLITVLAENSHIRAVGFEERKFASMLPYRPSRGRPQTTISSC